jgi:MarR family transcriptional regulator for hemolysin
MSIGETFASELGRVHRKWRARLDDRLKDTGLTHARWHALLTIWRQQEPPPTQRELAQSLGIEGPTLVRILDALEKEGLIERCAAEDRRAKFIKATKAARPLMAKIERIAGDLRTELLRDIPEEHLAIATGVLRDIGDKLER